MSWKIKCSKAKNLFATFYLAYHCVWKGVSGIESTIYSELGVDHDLYNCSWAYQQTPLLLRAMRAQTECKY